jgi:hypothetical protein
MEASANDDDLGESSRMVFNFYASVDPHYVVALNADGLANFELLRQHIARVSDLRELLHMSAQLVQMAMCCRISVEMARRKMEDAYAHCLEQCGSAVYAEQVTLLGDAVAVLWNHVLQKGPSGLAGCTLSLPFERGGGGGGGGGGGSGGGVKKVVVHLPSLDHLHALQRFWTNAVRRVVGATAIGPHSCIGAVATLASSSGHGGINLSASSFASLCGLVADLQATRHLPAWTHADVIAGSLQWLAAALDKLRATVTVGLRRTSTVEAVDLATAERAFTSFLRDVLDPAAHPPAALVDAVASEIKHVLSDRVARHASLLSSLQHDNHGSSSSSSSSSSSNNRLKMA